MKQWGLQYNISISLVPSGSGNFTPALSSCPDLKCNGGYLTTSFLWQSLYPMGGAGDEQDPSMDAYLVRD